MGWGPPHDVSLAHWIIDVGKSRTRSLWNHVDMVDARLFDTKFDTP